MFHECKEKDQANHMSSLSNLGKFKDDDSQLNNNNIISNNIVFKMIQGQKSS